MGWSMGIQRHATLSDSRLRQDLLDLEETQDLEWIEVMNNASTNEENKTNNSVLDDEPNYSYCTTSVSPARFTPTSKRTADDYSSFVGWNCGYLYRGRNLRGSFGEKA